MRSATPRRAAASGAREVRQQGGDPRVAAPAGIVGAVVRHVEVVQRGYHVHAIGIDREQAPAVRPGAARQHRAPVHHLLVHHEAGLLHVLGQHMPGGLRDRAGDLQHDHRLALVAGARQLRLRGPDIEARDLRAGGGLQRRVAHPEGGAVLHPEARRNADGAQDLLLVDELPHHPPHGGIGEGAARMVQAEIALEHVNALQLHQPQVAVAAEQVEEVEGQVLHVVDLAGDERVHPGGVIGHGLQHQLVDPHRLAAGQEVRRLGPRDVARVPPQHHPVARAPLVAREGEGAGADDLGDARIAGGEDAGGHDEGHRGVRLTQHLQHQRKRLLQGDAEAARILGPHRPHRRQQHAPEAVARGPSAQGDDAVLGRHRRAVVEGQAVAQGEAPFQPVGRDGVALRHLRPDRAAGILGEERVEDMIAEAARDRGRGRMGIEDHHLRFQHHRDGTGGARQARRGEKRGHGDGARPEKTAARGAQLEHGHPPVCRGGS